VIKYIFNDSKLIYVGGTGFVV